jgi:uncharacterized protein
MQDTVESIREFARKHFSDAKYSHDWEHTERVYRLAMHIGAVEGADLEILAVASYLHDIGRAMQDKAKGALCHAEQGAAIAAKVLEAYPIPGDKRENILHCIESHRFRNDRHPQTLEAKVLFDADKLDAIGAVGIARAYLFAGEVGAVLHNGGMDPREAKAYSRDDTGYREFTVKLSGIKDRMLTREGSRMAVERHAFMEAFFERFLEEHEGRL